MRIANRYNRTPILVISAFIVTGIAVRGAGGQAVPSTDTANVAAHGDTVRLPLTVSPAPRRLSPSGVQLGLAAMGVGVAEGVGGALTGNMIDYSRCSRKHRGEMGDLFSDPCLFYSGDGTKLGWFVGSFAGATGMAIAMARLRGCPLRPAFWRATAGSIVGMLPAIITGAKPSARTPSGRSWRIASAPVLGGLGASIAVAGCHR